MIFLKTIKKRHVAGDLCCDFQTWYIFSPCSRSILLPFTTRRSDRSNTKPINPRKTIPTTHPIVCFWTMAVQLLGPRATVRSQQTTVRCRVVCAMTSFHVPFFGRCWGMALCHIVGTSQFGVSPGRLEWRDCMTLHESIVARTRKSVLACYSAKYDRNLATDLYVSLRPYEHSMRICNPCINFATFTMKRD